MLDDRITRKAVAERIAAYLHHEISLEDLGEWAEGILCDVEFEDDHAATIAEVVGRLGVADVRAFGLTWENCERLLARLGYSARIDIVAA